MQSHSIAKTTPYTRELMVRRVLEQAEHVRDMAESTESLSPVKNVPRTHTLAAGSERSLPGSRPMERAGQRAWVSMGAQFSRLPAGFFEAISPPRAVSLVVSRCFDKIRHSEPLFGRSPLPRSPASCAD